MPKQVQIDYVNGVFTVTCPFWSNELLNDLLGKRWLKSAHHWKVPAVRRNIEALKALLPLADITEEVMAQLHKEPETLAPPEGFPAEYPFKTLPIAMQRQALEKAYGRQAFALYMSMGTGKSKIAIDIASALFLNNRINAVLVIVRRSLRLNWVGYDRGGLMGQREGFLGHSPVNCDCHLPKGGDGPALKKMQKWQKEAQGLPILIMSIESLSLGGGYRIAHDYLGKFTAVMTILDEAHDISEHRANRSERAHAIGAKSAYRMICTGTPISSGPLNLYSQFEFLDPNIIGMPDFWAFRNRYAVMGGFPNPDTGKGTQIMGYRNLEELTGIVAPYVFECRKEDMLDLPPKVYERRTLPMTPVQKKLYAQIKKEKAYTLGEGDITAIVKTALEVALRLQQITGGVLSRRELDPDAEKMITHWEVILPPSENPKIREVIDIVREGKPTIIWCLYRLEIEMMAAALREHFPEEEVLEIHGGVNEAERERVKSDFQSGKARILVGNTASGGTGLTLTACEIMIYYNNSRRMIDRVQSEDRAHRAGLNHSVLYIDLVMENTVDETVIEALTEKMDLAEYVRALIKAGNDIQDIF